MPTVVTGALGQLGRELCGQIGGSAIPLDVDTLDVTDGAAVERAMREYRPEVVINCAAYTQVDQAEREPAACQAVNATAVEHLVRACRELGCPLVQVSTNYAFGAQSPRGVPYRETDPPAPQGVYACSKLDGERAAAQYERHLILRTCGLYARPTDEHAKNFVRAMLEIGRSRGRVRVVGDQRCTPSYVPHVARAVMFLAGVSGGGAAPWGTYHVTNRGETTWDEFAREIFRQAGMEVTVESISTAEYGAAAPRPAYSVLDTAQYHSLGGPPMPDWQAALAEYFREWRAQCNGSS